jgi:hypothetical protein
MALPVISMMRSPFPVTLMMQKIAMSCQLYTAWLVHL